MRQFAMHCLSNCLKYFYRLISHISLLNLEIKFQFNICVLFIKAPNFSGLLLARHNVQSMVIIIM